MNNKRVYGGAERSRSYANKRGKSTPSDHSKLLRLQKVVAALKPELKVLYQAGAFANVSNATGSIALICGTSQGTDLVNRIGDSISPKRLKINMKVSSGADGVATSVATYMVYIVKDRDSNGVIPTISGAADSIFEGVGPLQALVRKQVADRFQVIASRRWDAALLVGGGDPTIVYMDLKLTGKTTYLNTGATITGAGHNQYYMVVLSDAVGNTVDFDYSLHFKFTDM